MARTSHDEVATLVTRIQELEARVAELEAAEKQRSPHRALRRAHAAAPGMTREVVAPSDPGPLPHAARVIEPACTDSDQRDGDFETLLGLTWFNRVGAGLLVVGFALAALWANDRGYLSPLLRNALGGVTAIATFWLGLRLAISEARGRRRFGIGVMLVGVCGLYSVPVTASRLDAVLPGSVATGLLVAVTVALGILALRYRSAALTLFGLLGGMALPLLAPSAGTDFIEVASCLAPVVIGFLWIQQAIGARRIELAASAGVLAYAGAWLAYLEGESWLALAVGLGIWLAHLGYARFLEYRKQSHRGFDIATVLAALVAAAGLITAASTWPIARAVLFLALLAPHGWMWRHRPRALLCLAGFAGAALLWLIAPETGGFVYAGSTSVQALLCTGVAAVFMAAYYARCIHAHPDQEYDAVATVASALFTMGWIDIGLNSGAMGTSAALIAAAAGAWLGIDVAVRRTSTHSLGHGWAQIMTVAHLAAAAITALYGSSSLAPETLSLWSSIVFIVGGLAFLAVGVRTGYPIARVLGLTALAASLVKIVATDVWSLSPGYRIATLIAIGLGLLCASFFYSRHPRSPCRVPSPQRCRRRPASGTDGVTALS